MESSPWSIVLAGGNGERLSGLTVAADGTPVPKQYCSIGGGPSLIGLAMARAARVSPRSRITAIVAAQHRRFWEVACHDLPVENVVVQPRNRGTAPGVLLPLLSVLGHDPDPTIVLLPSDHHVADEDALEGGVRNALAEVAAVPEKIALLGIPPDEIDAAFGWILPACSVNDVRGPVARFVEKPPATAAAELLERGGLWNSFILIARARTLLALYERRLPMLLGCLDGSAGWGSEHLDRTYAGLETADFSRDLLEGSEEHLTVVRVRPCGWSDLGTPERVARAVRRLDVPVQPNPGA